LYTDYTGYVNSPITFEFIAGALSLNLVDTVGDRGGHRTERLRESEDLAAWLRAVGLADLPKHSVTAGELTVARALREAIFRCGRARIEGLDMKAHDVRLINQVAAHMPLRPKLNDGEVILHATNLVEASLSTIAADATAVLAKTSRERIRICPECRMMFFDTSRPGMRRWCSSASGCGNRAKVRKHRARLRRSVSKGTT
jgi:predicted RNA-binding Zn ribbon-like protein